MTTDTDAPDWFHAAPGDPAVAASGGAADAVPVLSDDGDGPADDDLLDDWAPEQRSSRLTRALAVGLLGAIVFTGGALVQKQFGAGGAAASAGARGAFPGGAEGGFPGGGELPAGFPGGGQGQAGQGGGAPAGAASGAAASSTASAPAVVGTVASVAGTDLAVQNFAGMTVTVHVPATATVTTTGLTGVGKGMTVTVVGTKAADGSVTATSVVARTAA